jgi:hypothetical protein
MSIETELRALLVADAEVAALVATRVSADNIDQADARPFVVFRRADTDRSYTLSGALVGSMATLTVQCWAESRLAAEALADVCEAALLLDQRPTTNREADIDPDLDLFVTQFVVTWWE